MYLLVDELDDNPGASKFDHEERKSALQDKQPRTLVVYMYFY